MVLGQNFTDEILYAYLLFLVEERLKNGLQIMIRHNILFGVSL